MSKPKIAFISAYSPPELMSSSHLVFDVISEAKNAGLDTILVSPNQVRGLNKKERKKHKKTRIEEQSNYTHYIVRSISFFERVFFFRYLRYRVFCSKLKQILKTNKDIQFVFMWSYPPLGFSYQITKFCRKNNIKIIYNVHDIHPEITQKKNLISRIIKNRRDFVIKNANYICTLSRDMKNTIISLGIDKNRISVIYPWAYEIKSGKIPADIQNYFDKYKIISYVGNIGNFQCIDLLLEIAKNFPDKNNVMFLFVGSGAKAKKVSETAKKCKNISYFPKLNEYQAFSLYKQSDINIISVNKQVIFYACPSKTPLVLLSGKPALVIADNSFYTRNLANLGLTVDTSYDIHHIASQLQLMLNESKEVARGLGDFDRKISLNKWFLFFSNLI